LTSNSIQKDISLTSDGYNNIEVELVNLGESIKKSYLVVENMQNETKQETIDVYKQKNEIDDKNDYYVKKSFSTDKPVKSFTQAPSQDFGKTQYDSGADWKIVRNPSPVYPKGSIKRGEFGDVVIEIVVLPSGEIENSKIVLSSGFKDIDESALASSRRIKLKLINKDKLQKSVMRIPYSFKLRR
jgi:TonB family protein